jgi:hypothetical protein
MSLATPVAYGGGSVALRFDGRTALTLAVPGGLAPPFSVYCRFTSGLPGGHVVALGRWGNIAWHRSLRTAPGALMQVQESARPAEQSIVAFGPWSHNPGGTPPWCVVGGSWRPAGVPGKGRYAHHASDEFFSLDDTSDPPGTKGTPASDLVVGSDARGRGGLQGLIEWIWVVRHELTPDEWAQLKRINADTAIWPPDLVSDTAAFIPILANAPLVDVISGRELTVRAGAAITQSLGPTFLRQPTAVGTTLTLPYGSVASAPVPLPVPNKGIWRAQAHHDVRVETNGALAGPSSRLVRTGTGIVPMFGAGPSISVVADDPAHTGALNLTALV